MAVKGVCAYCSAPASTTCKLCGTPVCPTHTDQTTLACTRCSVPGRTGPPPGSREM